MIILRRPGGRETYVIIADEIGGVRDGSNQIFTTTYNYEPNRINFFYNGQALHSPGDFIESGSNEITLISGGIYPVADDILRANYELEGVTVASGHDHGTLTGLLDDDHPQYHTDARGDARYYIQPTVDALLDAQDEFIELLDTPATYSGSGGKYVAVKSDETGLEFRLEQYGVENLINGTTSGTVNFSQPFSDTNYAVTLGLENTVDSSPSIYAIIISTKTVNGFTVLFSGDIDSGNYKLNWIAKK